MKHFLPLLAFCILPASAQSITSDDAYQVARQFFTSHAASGAQHAPAKVEPLLAYTATTDGTPDLYVFNRAADATGFVVISADDTTMPVLGYSDSSSFDLTTAPANFLWWLEQYQRNGVARVSPKAGDARHDIAPFVTTEWGQNAPYNYGLPLLTPNSKRFVTGCTATAMAQIMKYFEYPQTGKGSHSYQFATWNTSQGPVTPTFEADFEATSYDWDNMLDSYKDGCTQMQADAVATLMYHAGVAEEAHYGQDMTSASDMNSGKALIEHFRYSPSLLRGVRDFFTDEEWENTIYQELAAGRPVFYAGATTHNEGHAFVCNGYEATYGRYYINWGWDGNCNGYFALTGQDVLNPAIHGTGGAASGLGYTESQSIIYNILDTEEGEYPIQAAAYNHFIVGTNPAVTTTFTSMTIDRSSDNADVPVYYRLTSYNYGFSTINIKSGVLLRHTTTGATYGEIGFDITMELIPGRLMEYSYSGAEYAHFNTSKAPYNGTYEIIPAYTTDNGLTWHPMAMRNGDCYPTITITGGEDAQAIELPFTISASEVEVGKTITIVPHTDFHGNVVYESSDPAVASVSPTGVVTGVSEGHATITATSEETLAFLPTTKTFDIDVVSHIMHSVVITLDKCNLMVGEMANITITKAYDGEVSYSVAPEGVVSVSDEGLVTALAEGDATITVSVEGTYDYRPITKVFDITVSNVPPMPAQPGFCMDAYPYVGEDNIATANDMTLHISLYNNSENEVNPAKFYVRMSCDGGTITWTCGFKGAYPARYHYDYTLDPAQYASYFTPGSVYTYEFYLDEACEIPMNVPSLVYYYCPDNPTVTTAAQLIDDAKNGNGATPKLIKSLTKKILKQ